MDPLPPDHSVIFKVTWIFRNHGVHPAALQYFEYEYKGSIINVILYDPKYFHHTIALAIPRTCLSSTRTSEVVTTPSSPRTA